MRRETILTAASILLLLFQHSTLAQEQHETDGSGRRRIPISVDDILDMQAGARTPTVPDVNERLRSMAAAARYSREYLFGPGDVVEVTVFGIDDLKQSALTLDAQGRIFLPFIGEVRLLGLTARESEVKIAALLEASILKNPQVAVSVKEYRSQFISVLGAVVRPGSYQLTRRAYLVDGLAMAGGLLTEKAGSLAYVNRETDQGAAEGGSAGPQTIEIDLIRLLQKGDLRLNIPLQPGDVITVGEREERFFYVLGDVHRGGAFEIRRGETVTLSKALASAGGFLSTAKSGDTVILRRSPGSDSAARIPTNVAGILKGLEEDPVIGPDDVVFVPGSTTRRVGRGLLGGITGILAALVYAGVR
jgi:polysaccharide export outer membrane protein